jgi:Papain family cysteine protease
MKTNLIIATLFLWLSVAAAAQGVMFNDNTYQEMPQKRSAQAVRRLPAIIDLSVYAPSVIDQGESGTCVGVSVGYYMRTIQEAQRRKLTKRSEIDKLRFSPSFLYNSIKTPTDSDCMLGADIAKALEYLKQNGLAMLSEQAYPYCQTNKPITPKSDSKILDYVKLFGLSDRDENVVLTTKKALSELSPVVVGIQTTSSFGDLSFRKTFFSRGMAFFGSSTAQTNISQWKPATDASTTLSYGHAMCVVGYDDKKFGGAFRLVNSWGDYWGEDGYFWMTYADYKKYVKYGYQAYLEPLNAAQNTLSVDLTISVGTFVTGTEEEVVRSNANTKLTAYAFKKPQRTGTPYKFSANVSKQTYVYMIAANATENITTKLFPNQTYSPIIGANTKLDLPNDELLTLIDPKGTEYWLFLFSEKAIDIDGYVKKINESKGPFPDRVIEAFGDALLPYQQVNYKEKKMGFFLKNQQRGRIVPLLVSMNHI